ncbi:MAG: DUF4367 domain-containing protein [Chloroflexota bacterium]|nr:DUF4367 domain-containing protein [Chloroflexota bacterium]
MHQNDEMLDIERQSVGKDLWALADAIAYRKTLRTELRKRLMAQARALDVEKEVRTLGSTSQDKGEARSPLWFQRLAQGVGRIRQVFQVRGGLTMKKGFALAALAALIMTISIVAFVPSVRALAQEMLDALMGHVTQIKVITIEEGMVTRERVVTVESTEPQTLAEVQARVDFNIWLPTCLPKGYTEMRFETPSPNQVVIQFHTLPGSGQSIRSFELYEIKGDAGRLLGGETVQELLVNGNVAIWTKGKATEYDEAGNSSPLVHYVLYWEEDEISFALSSYTLPLEEMVRIAESLE